MTHLLGLFMRFSLHCMASLWGRQTLPLPGPRIQSFHSPSMRFLGRFPCCEAHCFLSDSPRESTNVSPEYLHSFQMAMASLIGYDHPRESCPDRRHLPFIYNVLLTSLTLSVDTRLCYQHVTLKVRQLRLLVTLCF